MVENFGGIVNLVVFLALTADGQCMAFRCRWALRSFMTNLT